MDVCVNGWMAELYFIIIQHNLSNLKMSRGLSSPFLQLKKSPLLKSCISRLLDDGSEVRSIFVKGP